MKVRGGHPSKNQFLGWYRFQKMPNLYSWNGSWRDLYTYNDFMQLGFYFSNLTIVQMNSELRPKTSKGDIIVHATILRGCHLWGRRMCTAARQPRSLSLAASEANYGHQCFVALDLDFSQVSANFTAFAKVCRLLYILPCLLLLLLIASCWWEIPFHHNTQFSVVRHYQTSSLSNVRT